MITKGRCVNGCNKPICPPSKVICKDCLDKISNTLRDLAKGTKTRERDNKISKTNNTTNKTKTYR